MRRGDVWWASLPPPAGDRPVVLLSRDAAYSVRALVTVAPITTRIRKIPVEVPLGRADGMPKSCVVNLDSITTIPKAVLDRRMGSLSKKKVEALNAALRFALQLKD
jgi:mRNA interferase MazF